MRTNERKLWTKWQEPGCSEHPGPLAAALSVLAQRPPADSTLTVCFVLPTFNKESA